MMTTIYERAPQDWDAVAKRGSPNLREMAMHFTTYTRMADALGAYELTIKNWTFGSLPQAKWDRIARVWLDRNVKPAATPAPVVAPPPVQADASGVLMLVVAPSAVADKARKLLALIGCEVEDV